MKTITLGFAAALFAGLAFAGQVNPPTPNPVPVASGGTGASTSAASRAGLGNVLFLRPEEQSPAAIGGELDGAANYTASGTGININALITVTASLTFTNSSGVVSVSPAWAVPAFSGGLSTSPCRVKVSISSSFVSNSFACLSSVNTGAGTFTLANGTATSSQTVTATITFVPQADGFSTLGGGAEAQYIGPVGVSAGNAVLGSAIVDKNAQGMLLDIRDGSGNVFLTTVSNVGTDFETLTPATTLPSWITNGSTYKVTFGEFLLPSNGAGMSIEIPQAGAVTGGITTSTSGNSTGTTLTVASTANLYAPMPLLSTTSCIPSGAWIKSFVSSTAVLLNQSQSCGNAVSLTFGGEYLPLIRTVQSVADPLNATLTSSVTTSVIMQAGTLVVGPDDTNAFLAMETAAYGAPSSAASLSVGAVKMGYISKRHFLASMDVGADSAAHFNSLVLCGPGYVRMPAASLLYKGVAKDCMQTPRAKLSDERDYMASVVSPSILSKTPGSTITVDLIGNSAVVNGSNGLGLAGSTASAISDAFRDAFPDYLVQVNNRSIGGTLWGFLDPAGYVWSGQSIAGIPPTTTPVPSWFAQCPTTWMSCVAADDPDFTVYEFTNVDGGYYGLGAMLDVINYTQSAAWKTATGGTKNPYVVLMTDLMQPTNFNYQWGNGYPSSFMRGFARDGQAYSLAAANSKIGLFDRGRWGSVALEGVDPTYIPQARADYIPSPAGNVSLPWQWPAPVSDFGFNSYITLTSLGVFDVAHFWAAVGEFDMVIGAGTSGNQYWGFPAGNNGPGASIGYPNQMMRVWLNTGTNKLRYEVDAYNFTSPPVCGGTASGTSFSCSVAVANLLFHNGASISVAGAGAAGATLTANGVTISADGKTITLPSGTIGTTVANASITFSYATVPAQDSKITPDATASGWGGTSNNGNCWVNTGLQVNTRIGFEASGNRLRFMYCATGSLGPSQLIELTVPRFQVPFRPWLYTPGGSFGGVAQLTGPSVYKYVSGSGRASTATEGRPDLPLYTPSLRFVPDLYSYCTGTTGLLPLAPFGGQCQNHSGWLGRAFVDEEMFKGLRLRP